MPHDNTARDRKAEAHATFLGRKERIEQLGKMFGLNPRSIVRNTHTRIAVGQNRACHGNGTGPFASLGNGLRPVENKVEYNLLQLYRITPYQKGILRQTDGHGNVPLHEIALREFQRRGNYPVEIELFKEID